MKFLKTLTLVFFICITFSTSSKAFTLVSGSITAGWDTRELTFEVNESSCTALGITALNLYAAIDAAVELWNKAPTANLKLKRGGVNTSITSTNPPTIYCDTLVPTPDSVAGIGRITQLTGGHPSLGSVEINGDATKAAYFNNLNATYASVLLAHEMGHVLGLGHSEKVYALMYYDITSKTHLNLSQDDVDGLTWLNPRDETDNGLMGCASIQDISGRMPPPGNSAGLIFNWALLVLVAFTASRFKTNIRRN